MKIITCAESSGAMRGGCLILREDSGARIDEFLEEKGVPLSGEKLFYFAHVSENHILQLSADLVDKRAYLVVTSILPKTANSAFASYCKLFNLERFEWENSGLEHEINSALVCMASGDYTVALYSRENHE